MFKNHKVTCVITNFPVNILNILRINTRHITILQMRLARNSNFLVHLESVLQRAIPLNSAR
jgi:hypothetical protein